MKQKTEIESQKGVKCYNTNQAKLTHQTLIENGDDLTLVNFFSTLQWDSWSEPIIIVYEMPKLHITETLFWINFGVGNMWKCKMRK